MVTVWGIVTRQLISLIVRRLFNWAWAVGSAIFGREKMANEYRKQKRAFDALMSDVEEVAL